MSAWMRTLKRVGWNRRAAAEEEIGLKTGSRAGREGIDRGRLEQRFLADGLAACAE